MKKQSKDEKPVVTLVPKDIPDSKHFLDRMKRIMEVTDRRGVDVNKTAEHIKSLLKEGITYKFSHHPDVYPMFEDLLLRSTSEDGTKMALAVLKAFEDLKLMGSVTAGLLYNELYFSSMSGHVVIRKIMSNIRPLKWDPARAKKPWFLKVA